MTFRSARARLTIWYTGILMVITVLFSVVIYAIQMQEVRESVQTVRFMIVQDYGFPPRPERVLIINETALNNARHNIIKKLTFTNIGILAIAGAAAYFLAGRTLSPIEKSVQAQKQFVSDASHEIRTPLTALRTTLEVSLRNDGVVGDAREALEDSLTQVTQLQELTSSLLSLSRLESQSQLLYTDFDIQDVVSRAMTVISPLAERKNVRITLDGGSVRVYGDFTKLYELFVILLDNAVKYSEAEKEVFVRWNKIRGMLQTTVEDQGIGIPAKDLPRIFDRFYRVDESRSHENGGYGLGLAIANRIMDLHKGTISVVSTEGKGSIFKISFPVSK